MSKKINMTQGKPLGLMLSFSLPLMLGNIFQQLYTVTDAAIVGQGVGMEALAAFGTVDWLCWLILSLMIGFTQGFSVRISQRFGAGDQEGLKQVVGQSALLSAVLAVGCVIFGQLAVPLFLNLLGVPSNLRPMAELYVRIIFGGIPAMTFFNYCSAVLRAVGDSKTPLKAMLLSSCTNIVLDCLAVFVLGLGIGGAAAATVIAQCVSGIFCARKIWKTPELRFEKEQFRVLPALASDLLKRGAPLAVKNMMIALGGMSIQSVVNHFETGFIAGFTASNKLFGILEMAASAYGSSVSTFVGQNYGAQRLDRIQSGMRTATWLGLGTSAFISTMMILFGRPITQLFISSENPEQFAVAANTAYEYLVFMAAALPALYLLYNYLLAIQALGNSLIPMISGIFEFVIRVSLAETVRQIGIQRNIFFAEVFAWTDACVFLAVCYYAIMRKLSHQMPSSKRKTEN